MSIRERRSEKDRILFRGPREIDKAIFNENLDLIHPYLSTIFKSIHEQYAIAGGRRVKMADICARIVQQNPCHTTRPEIKYPYIIKSFLYAAYCGMTASELWDGKCEAKNVNIPCSYENEIKGYLFDNSYFEFEIG